MSPREIEFNFMLKKLKRQTDSHELIFGREPESCVQGSMPRDRKRRVPPIPRASEKGNGNL